MGYSHFFYRKNLEISSDIFNSIVTDFRKVLPVLESAGVRIAGPLGEGDPEIGPEGICFNGVAACGHLSNDVGIAWPAKEAQGVAGYAEDPVKGEWFAGATLAKRACSGHCDHETFDFPRVYNAGQETGSGYFDCCKTGFKPYDWALNCVLIIATHYLGNDLSVRSDGNQEEWMDGMLVCQQVLGYGAGFSLDKD